MLLLRKAKLYLQYQLRPINSDGRILERLILNNRRGSQRLKILDFGCGSGIYCDYLGHDLESKYFGIDKNFADLVLARKFFPENYFFACGENTCFKDNSIDYIVATNVLHHLKLKQINKLILEFNRILKDGGKLILLEAVERSEQIGVVFRLVTFLEVLIKNVKFKNHDYYKKILQKYFHEEYFEKSNNNFYISMFDKINSYSNI